MRESKSISTQERGQICERKAYEYYKNKNFKIIGSNEKIFSVEIDLILFKKHYYFIEVKSLRRIDEISFRISSKQIKRLLRARDFYSTKTNQEVEVRVLYVLPDQLIELQIEDHF